ncbi:hypothetical protein MMC15_004750 [Xylographa vitiligo]|nr:hypothetical protein [Xylographa vitiligo]
MQLTHTLLLAVLSLTSLSAAQYHPNRLSARDLAARNAHAYAAAAPFYADDDSEALYARDAADELDDFLYARTVSQAELLRKMQQNKGEKCRKNCAPMTSHGADAYEDCYNRCMAL